MNLKLFSWSCLLLAILAVAYQLLVKPGQATEAASLFSSTMILMAVGFSLVRRELAKLQPNEPESSEPTQRKIGE